MGHMKLLPVGTFAAEHGHLAWPWVAIDPTRHRFAFVAKGRLETRALHEGALASGPTFALPEGLALPTEPPPAEGHRGALAGLHGFALAPAGDLAAFTGTAHGASVLVTSGPEGERVRTRIDALVPSPEGAEEAPFVAHAVTFDRRGTHLWISCENGKHTAIVLVSAETHALAGYVQSAPFPPPASHELFVHPVDDAVLLLAACGQDGTFARVAGHTGEAPVAIPTELDSGSVPSGFVGFSADGARVHLVEADELRTHAWPGLHELSSVELDADFVSAYSGVVMGDRILLDGHDEETGEFDSVMIYDRSAIRGGVAKPPFPEGMWVGRLGEDALVSLSPKGDPAPGFVVRLPAPAN